MGGAGIVVKKKKQRVFGNSLFYPRIQPRNLFYLSLVTLLLSVIGTCNSTEEEIQIGEDVTQKVNDIDCGEDTVDCATELLPGQYLCLDLDIDSDTQQLRGCEQINETGKGKAPQVCLALPGIKCNSFCNQTFIRYEDCKWTNGYHFDTALLLSVFLGMFGVDRFYLGYPAIGLLKFSTLGFFFIGHLVDIILIATQNLGPADGSYYIINYFGAGLTQVSVNEETYRREQADWY